MSARPGNRFLSTTNYNVTHFNTFIQTLSLSLILYFPNILQEKISHFYIFQFQLGWNGIEVSIYQNLHIPMIPPLSLFNSLKLWYFLSHCVTFQLHCEGVSMCVMWANMRERALVVCVFSFLTVAIACNLPLFRPFVVGRLMLLCSARTKLAHII